MSPLTPRDIKTSLRLDSVSLCEPGQEYEISRQATVPFWMDDFIVDADTCEFEISMLRVGVNIHWPSKLGGDPIPCGLFHKAHGRLACNSMNQFTRVSCLLCGLSIAAKRLAGSLPIWSGE